MWQYYRDEPATTILSSESFKSKIKIIEKTRADGNAKNVKKAIPLKCFRNFWRSLEMSLINCEINLNLTWFKDCVISSAAGETKFAQKCSVCNFTNSR